MSTAVHFIDPIAAILIGRGSRAGFSFYDEPLPIRSWRQLMWSSKTFNAFPLAVLEGHFFPCPLCGDCHSHVGFDGNQKCIRRHTAGGENVVYDLPNAPLIPDTVAAPALRAIPRLEAGHSVSRTCSGPDGESHWQATRPAYTKGKASLDKHGIGLMACYHRATLKMLAMSSPEACSRDHVMAILLALALRAGNALSDIVCMLLKHIRAQGERDFSEVLQLLADEPLTSRITLSVHGDGKYARFVSEER